MYKCEKCGRPLNEFDVGFSERLSEANGNHECKCFRCTTGKSVNEFGHKLGKIVPFSKDYLWGLGVTLISAIIIGIGAFLGNSNSDTFGRIIFSGLLNTCGALFLFFGWAYVAIELTGAGLGEIREIGEHYETTLRNDGTFETKTVKDYSGGGGCLIALCTFLGIFTIVLYPMVYLSIRIYKPFFGKLLMLREYPQPVIDAYNYTYNRIKRAKIPEKVFLKYKKEAEKNNKRINDIRRKYSIMGENAVNDQLRRICPPTVTATVGGKHYVIAHFVTVKPDYRCYLIRKNSNGEMEGKVVMNDYFLCSATNDWREDWAMIDYGKALELAERIKNYI